ncbi:MAG: 4Fe-4S dicluster domain-containing protein [Bryobacterales bacterium]|nr:4Fe-4S dicluster domain-containing protein [Bryobacterales bacterium]
MAPVAEGKRFAGDRESLKQLIELLASRGYEVIGPTVRDGAVVYDRVASVADLPGGWRDVQEAGQYRLERRDDEALFGYVVGPQSWKKFLHPSDIRLLEAKREGSGFRIIEDRERPKRYAFVGVRACEVAAIRIQDRVLLEDRYTDLTYRGRRSGAFIVAVNCTEAAGTCFCTSMGTGPRVEQGFDLALTEVVDGSRHLFLMEAGTAAGEEILRGIGHEPAPEGLCAEADRAVERAAVQRRRIETSGLREVLYQNFEHARWDQVASRCLSCANCTMVCPTCFCTTVEDTSDVTGDHAERWRRWDSCFTQAFSYIHGGSVRTSVRSRYRQWMTHKLASWVDQFGTPGCVGCGRCITWCPAGIDITEEVTAIRESVGHAT